jgi:lipid A 3-O-deacylase
LVNFALPMKKYPSFILILVLLSQCNFSELNHPVRESLPAMTKIPAGSKFSGTPENRDFFEDTTGKNKADKSKSSRKNIKRKTYKNKYSKNSAAKDFHRMDSSRISKLTALRKSNTDIDLNEPVSREFLLATNKTGKFASMIQLSREAFIRINFDNDILDYTDRFYTNGIRFDFISPALQQFPLSKLMVPYWRSGINYYGISLVQNMYTPSSTKMEGILFGDRPYAAYLFFGTFKITNDPVRNFRQISELDLGVIGSYSFGEYIQKSFHSEVPTNSIPLGWEYQIKNDLVLNYHLTYEKGIYNRRNIDLNLSGSGSLGTLYTNISGGFLFRTGLQNPYFINLGQSKRRSNRENGLRNTQVIFFVTSRAKLVGYDATLEGGFFNKSSVYTISSSNISRFVYQGSAGFTMVLGGTRLDIEQFVLSPEFHNGWWHKWVHIAFTFSL